MQFNRFPGEGRWLAKRSAIFAIAVMSFVLLPADSYALDPGGFFEKIIPRVNAPKAGKPSAGKPKSSKPKSSKPRSSKPKSAQSESARSKDTQPKGDAPKSGQPMASQPPAAIPDPPATVPSKMALPEPRPKQAAAAIGGPAPGLPPAPRTKPIDRDTASNNATAVDARDPETPAHAEASAPAARVERDARGRDSIGELAFAAPVLASPLAPTGGVASEAEQALGDVIAPEAPGVARFDGSEAAGAQETPLPRDKPDIELAALVTPRRPAVPQELALCRTEMSGLKISAEAQPPVEAGACGAPDPFAVTALEAGAVTLEPKATTNCETASMLARWIGEDVQPAARAVYGGRVTAIRVADSYSCRRRNQIVGAQLSEHSFMNAVDIGALEIGGRWVTVARTGDHSRTDTDFIEAIRHAACARFMTVLGPGSDGYHEDHLHLDMRHRGKNGDSRYCH